MDVEFDDPSLDDLEINPTAGAEWGQTVVRGFRKVMQAIRNASDERDLYAMRGLRFEKLLGKRQHQHSLRINEQWRLIVELRGKGNSKKVTVVCIEDYH
jgi:toxin HigB-1